MNEQWSTNNDNNSLSSESSNEDRIVEFFSNQRNLPLKKRFGATCGNQSLNFKNESEAQENPWSEKQQSNNKTPGLEQNVQKPDQRKSTISQGVIRHTSQPDTCLAYYYNYSSNEKH